MRSTRDLAEQSGRDTLYLQTAQLTANDITVLDHVLGRRKFATLDVVLSINGGSVDAGRYLARYLGSRAEHLRCLVPGIAASVGTLVALGADEIAFGPAGCLSPVDPSVSATMPNGARYEMASEDVRELPAALQEWFPEALGREYEAVVQRINPVVISQLFRADREVFTAVVDLLSTGRLLLAGHAPADVATHLLRGFSSHEHAIDLPEARRLGLDATAMTEDEVRACHRLVEVDVLAAAESEVAGRRSRLACILDETGPLAEKLVLADGGLAWVRCGATDDDR